VDFSGSGATIIPVHELTSLPIHPDCLAHLFSLAGLLVWRRFIEHLPKLKTWQTLQNVS